MLDIGYLNINSIRNKTDSLKLLVKTCLDIFIIYQAKLNITFPEGQFHMDGFTPSKRMDINLNGSGVELYVIEGIPS